MDYRWFLVFAVLAFLLFLYWPRNRLNRIWASANSKLDQGRYTESEQLYHSLLHHAENLSDQQKQQYLFPAVYGIALSKTRQESFREALPLLERATTLMGENEAVDVAVGTWCELAFAAAISDDKDTVAYAFGRLSELVARHKPVEQDLGLDLVRQFGEAAAARRLSELAEEFFRLVLFQVEKRSLPDPDVTVQTKLALAELYQVLGRLEESEELIQQTTHENYVVLESVTLQEMRLAIANQASAVGDHQKSIENFRLLIDDLKNDEADSIRIVHAQIGLCIALFHYGDYKEAFRLTETILKHRAKIHPIDPKFDLYFLPMHTFQGTLSEVEKTIYRLERSSSKNQLSAELYICCLGHRVHLLTLLNRDEPALLLAQRTLASSERAFGTAHPITAQSRFQVGCTLANMQRPQEAREYIRADNSQVITPRADLLSAWIAIQSNDYEDADRTLKELQSALADNFAPGNSIYHDIYRYRGLIAAGRGNHVEAVERFAECEAQMLAVRPANHPILVWLYEPWEESLRALGEHSKADEKVRLIKEIEVEHAAITDRLVSHAISSVQQSPDPPA